MDVVLLSRLQFAITIGFHFIFAPVSIGLAWMVTMAEWRGWRGRDPAWARIGQFLGRLLAVNFAAGVASGLVMEFQFGTNWAGYSAFVGDIFGAPLAAESFFAFFLESGFLGLYLFGRERVSKGLHWLASFLVALGATLSAFWIVAANSWQQTPAGYVLRNGRAELTDFWEAMLNASTSVRFFHTLVGALISGAFVVLGIAAYHLLKNPRLVFARKSMRLALFFGLGVSILALFPTGHSHAQQVARTQPEKFAAIEGLYESRTHAPLLLFAVPGTEPPTLHAPIEVPGLLSWMAFGEVDAYVPGIDSFPPEDLPPLWLTFVSFHNMVVLGLFFIALTGLALFRLWRGKLWTDRWLLRLMVAAIPLPVIACQLGWTAAEVGRQPWLVYKLLRTSEGHSANVSAADVTTSLVGFGLVYLLLGSLWLSLMIRRGRDAPQLGEE